MDRSHVRRHPCLACAWLAAAVWYQCHGVSMILESWLGDDADWRLAYRGTLAFTCNRRCSRVGSKVLGSITRKHFRSCLERPLQTQAVTLHPLCSSPSPDLPLRGSAHIYCGVKDGMITTLSVYSAQYSTASGHRGRQLGNC
ncbi:hypothetical protein B0I35DRAFT_13098 [Stachybotrys elegans]|uniref:Secreted protein n=1 Tax=Stachybotrys elegans TaxID=80388 RepID=A0A8K0T2N5_9HYPO|nr:hypothetical protein B0I35DRAFT_13098 [Stachybotrys elegans]